MVEQPAVNRHVAGSTPALTASDFINPDGSFNCIQCAACCKTAWLFDESFDRGDGVCKHLKRNLCSIYASRPDWCRVSNSDAPPQEQAEACAYLAKYYGVEKAPA